MAPIDGLVARAESWARSESENDTGGHDWWHTYRVRDLALRIADREGADRLEVELAAILHDIDDYKKSSSESSGPKAVYLWLLQEGGSETLAKNVSEIVAGVSFKGAGVRDRRLSLEGACVRDADRLDALGAIGIARAFAYGGTVGRALHDPDYVPVPHSSVAEYRAGRPTTVGHFHEKLLLLHDRMETSTGQRIAAGRDAFMRDFLARFLREWGGVDGEE